jgi:hypothetical protein
MDDYDLNTLTESKNEWCIRLTNVFTPCIISGLKSIYNEALLMCTDNDEESKYLMTFQNLLINIPKWGQATLDIEQERIVKSSNCNYIEDLISCVHIIQLKALTACRAGIKQRKINIQIPNLSSFIHKIYINAARKMYLNIYLFEKDIPPLQIQKNNRELEIIIKEIILNTVRENIPVEDLLKAYLDETEETDVVVEEKRETIVDKEQMEENLKLEKEKEKEREKDSAKPLEQLSTEDSTEITDVSSSDDRDLLLKMNKSLEDMNVNTTNLDLSPSEQTNDSGEKTIMSAPILEKEDTSTTLKIEDNDLTNSLEILDINTLDTEPDIKLDIEELI